jgi:hypothetical protein
MTPIQTYLKVLSKERKTFPRSFWTKKTAKTIIKYLIKKESPHPSEINYNWFRERKVFRAIITLGYNLYDILNKLFPGKYKPWEIKFNVKWKSKQGKKLAISATRDLFKRKLGLKKKEDIVEYATANLFQDYGLAGMLSAVYRNNVFLALRAAYPDVQWEDTRHSIRVGKKYISKHGHKLDSLFERRIDDYIGKRKHRHHVRYPHSTLDCDIVVGTGPRAIWIECIGMKGNKQYQKNLDRKRKLAKKHKLKLVELYLKDDWKGIRKKLERV